MPILSSIGGGSARGFGFRGGGRAPYVLSYLVIAGGNTGWYGHQHNPAGGGGAGGYRSSYPYLFPMR